MRQLPFLETFDSACTSGCHLILKLDPAVERVYVLAVHFFFDGFIVLSIELFLKLVYKPSLWLIKTN